MQSRPPYPAWSQIRSREGEGAWSGWSVRWMENLYQLLNGSGKGLTNFFLNRIVFIRDDQRIDTVGTSTRFSMEWNNDTRRHALVLTK